DRTAPGAWLVKGHELNVIRLAQGNTVPGEVDRSNRLPHSATLLHDSLPDEHDKARKERSTGSWFIGPVEANFDVEWKRRPLDRYGTNRDRDRAAVDERREGDPPHELPENSPARYCKRVD